MSHSKNNKLTLGAILVASLFATGCAVTPDPIKPRDQAELLKQDRSLVTKSVEPLGASLSMHEAIARGIKYNMDHRQKMLEQAVALGAADLSKFDMLPRVLATAGYSYRDKFLVTETRDADGNVIGTSDISSDRAFTTSGLTLTWSLLDFGISYYNAQQNADKILVASQRRRRTMHMLTQDIQTAYLRAAAAEKLKASLVATINDASEALENARKVEAQGLRPLNDSLRFQKTLLDNVKILRTIDQELSSARVELNRLINAPATSSYKLQDPDSIPVPQSYASTDVQEFEVRALMFNADLSESIYNARIAAKETRKALLSYLPGLTLNYGPQRTDNSYYIDKSWTEGAAQISFNLFNLLAAPAASDLAKAKEEVAQQKRMAMQMAAISQVHLVKQQVESALQLYRLSSDIDAVDSRLAKLAVDREKQGATSKAERVAAESSAIVSRLRKYQALSAVFTASSKMQSTAGLEPEIGSIDSTPLSQIELAVKQSFERWNSGVLPALPPELVADAASAADSVGLTGTASAAAVTQVAAAGSGAAVTATVIPVPVQAKPTEIVLPVVVMPASAQISEAQIIEKTQQWAGAWAAKDFGTYAGFYAQGFQPQQHPGRQAWLDFRQPRVERQGTVQVRLSEVRGFPVAADQIEVQFRQQYAAADTRESSFKRLVWVKEGRDWRILREDTVTELSGQRADRLVAQANQQLQQGESGRAAANFKEALVLNPSLVQARLSLAIVQAGRGEMVPAMDTLEKGLALAPQNPVLTHGLARLQWDAGQQKLARATLERNLAYAQNDPAYHSLYATIVQAAGVHDQAIKHYAVALQSDPDSALWLVGMAISLEALGQRASARQAYERAIATNRLPAGLLGFVEQRLAGGNLNRPLG